MGELVVDPAEMDRVSSDVSEIADSVSASPALPALSRGRSAMPGSASRASIDPAGSGVDSRRTLLVDRFRDLASDILAAKNAFIACEEGVADLFHSAGHLPGEAVPSRGLLERMG